MEKNPYEKNKYLEKHQHLNVSQAELERKWRLYEEEQEAMKLMMGVSAPGNAWAIPFISTWKTDNLSTGSSASNQVKLPLMPDGAYNFLVNWGDNTISSIAAWNQAETTHTYATPGTYTITITGAIRGWDWGTGTSSATPTTGDRLKILTITQWGCLRFVDKGESTLVWGAFYNCTNLTLLTVTDTPNFEGTGSLLGMFRGCSAITTINNINKWDVSGISCFRSMFRDMRLFNDNIGNWNTANATNFIGMFYGSATTAPYGSFNNGGSDTIKNWNTSKVTSFSSMFINQVSFNQEVGLWNTSSATSFANMFQTSATSVALLGIFNNAGLPSINNWNTSNVTDMSVMFNGQRLFNQPVGNWDTTKVTNMNYMFYASFVSGYPGVFNQDLSNWNTGNVTNMGQMFFHQPNFNQNIGGWNVSKVTTFASMFSGFNNAYGVFNNGGSNTIKNWNTSSATNMSGMFSTQKNFNQEVGLWDVSKVTTFSSMFYLYASGLGAFNNGGTTSINNWNTAAVTDMTSLFQNQTQFNQVIGSWNVSLVTVFTNFMTGKTLTDYSTANYDALLIGWALRAVKPSISINFGTIKYTAAATASRAILTSAPNNWTIVDGGL